MTNRFQSPEPCDPCEEVQSDISALLDGELDGSEIRRLLVHTEICPRCKRFLSSLRAQMELHRRVSGPGRAPAELVGGAAQTEDLFAGDLFEEAADAVALEEPQKGHTEFFAKVVAEGADRLAEIFFQLGRAYYLLCTNPHFFLGVAKEPVPIPEYRLRGKAVLAGVSSGGGKGEQRWIEASEILDGKLDSSETNLEKSRQLLEECLQLRYPYPAAQILLAHYHLQKENFDKARTIYRTVLRQTARTGGPCDRTTKVPYRVYALEHLGILAIAEERPGMATRYFRRVIDSGAMDIHPSFLSGPLNLSYAYLLIGRNTEVCDCLETIYRRFPDGRDQVAKFLSLRPKYKRMLKEQPKIQWRLAGSCPEWFGTEAKQLEHGKEVDYQLVFHSGPKGSAKSKVATGAPAAGTFESQRTNVTRRRGKS